MRYIAFFLPDFNGGGAERAVLEVVTHWPQASPLTPIVIVRAKSGPLAGAFQASDIEVISLGLRHRADRSTSIRTVLALRRLFKARRIELLLTFLSAPAPVLAARTVRRRPLVGVSIQNPPGSGTAGFHASIVKAAVLSSLRLADVVLSPTEGMLGSLPARIRTKSHYAPNPVDTERVQPGRRRSGEAYRVGMVGRLAPQKRYDLAIESFALADIPDSELHIWGTGDSRVQRELSGLLDRYGIADRVTFHGFQADIEEAFMYMDCLLLTSDYEGFGNVIVEALAAGRPVVATDVPFGPRDIIQDSLQGVLVHPGEPSSIADGLRTVHSLPDTEHLVAHRRARALRFNSSRVAQDISEICDAAIEPSAKP